MAITVPIDNGKVVQDSTTSSKTNSTTSTDKEMFLKLLVAEMQYQDPLEPTSNTDYVKELASFSQIEAVQAVQEQMSTLEANSLVGKYVILLTTGTSGNSEYVSGKVDYVMTDEEGKMFLSVNESLYSIDDLDSVCDEAYYNAVIGAQDFHSAVSQLPNVYTLTTKDEEKLTLCRKFYDSLDEYQKQFISADDVKTLTALEERMDVLKKAEEIAESEETGETEETEEAEETTEGVEE